VELTSDQRIALERARALLADGDTKRKQETGDHPGLDAPDLAYWVGRYRKALEFITEAFPADGAS
jgi:hypothetical protein